MRILSILLVVIVVAAGVAGSMSLFVVEQTQQALVLQFGEALKSVNAWGEEEEPGLKVKLPWQNVIYFDRRNLDFDTEQFEIIAANKERLLVDAFARYRISDPLKFYQAVTDERIAETRIRPFLEAAIRRVLGGVPPSDIIAGQRATLMLAIRDAVNQQALESGLGIEIIDVRIKRADLPDQNAERVFARMETERRQAAALIRAQGEERARRVRAEADRDVRVTLAEAREGSEKIKGDGDAQRNKIYAEAYELDREFFSFYRSMLAYEASISQGTTMLLSPDSDFFRYFGDSRGGAGSKR